MMKATIRYVLPYLIAALLIGSSLWLIAHFERVEHREQVGYRNEAKRNPLLAAQRLLEKRGIEVHSVFHIGRVINQLSPGDTLLIAQNDALNPEDTRVLLDWLRQGGRLIMDSDALYDETNDEMPGQTDMLLDALGIRQYSYDWQGDEPGTLPLPVTFEWSAKTFRVQFAPDYQLDTRTTPLFSVHGEQGQTHLLYVRFGQGQAVVMSDLWFMFNEGIDQYDHAWFLWHLLNLGGTPQRVWLLATWGVTGKEHTSDNNLVNWLLERTLPMIVASMLMLCLGLWAAAHRFGPLLPSPTAQRRRLLEHIEASGHFLWRQGEGERLLQQSQQAILSRLFIIHPDWQHLTETERLNEIAHYCHLPLEQVETALHPHHSLNEAAFTSAMQALAAIHQAL